jgi:hypothetical protein
VWAVEPGLHPQRADRIGATRGVVRGDSTTAECCAAPASVSFWADMPTVALQHRTTARKAIRIRLTCLGEQKVTNRREPEPPSLHSGGLGSRGIIRPRAYAHRYSMGNPRSWVANGARGRARGCDLDVNTGMKLRALWTGVTPLHRTGQRSGLERRDDALVVSLKLVRGQVARAK